MNFKNALAVVGLTAIAGLAPLQSKANGTNQTEKTSVRQEQFQAVLRTAMNAKMDVSAIKDEAVKYIDFPSFIPVTKDGKFDMEACQQMVKDFDIKGNFPHIKKYLESAISLEELEKMPEAKGFLETLDSASLFERPKGTMENAHIGLAKVDKAYVELAKNIANGDKEKEQRLLNAYLPLKGTAKEMPEGISLPLFVSAGLLLAIGIGIVKNSKGRDEIARSGCLTAIVAAGFIGIGLLTGKTDSDRIEYLEKALPYAYQAGYNAFVDRAIATEATQIVTMDTKQAAEMVKFSQEQAQTNLYQKASARDRK